MNNSHYHAPREREGGRERERLRESEFDFAMNCGNRCVNFKGARVSVLGERAILIQFDISLLK